jgi:hypothetical protein
MGNAFSWAWRSSSYIRRALPRALVEAAVGSVAALRGGRRHTADADLGNDFGHRRVDRRLICDRSLQDGDPRRVSDIRCVSQGRSSASSVNAESAISRTAVCTDCAPERHREESSTPRRTMWKRDSPRFTARQLSPIYALSWDPVLIARHGYSRRGPQRGRGGRYRAGVSRSYRRMALMDRTVGISCAEGVAIQNAWRTPWIWPDRPPQDVGVALCAP